MNSQELPVVKWKLNKIKMEIPELRSRKIEILKVP